jgi:hypothetical protein
MSTPVQNSKQTTSTPSSKVKSPKTPDVDDGGTILPITDAVCDYLISHVLMAVILPSWSRNRGGTENSSSFLHATKSPSFALIDPGVAMLVLANMLQIFRYKRLSSWLERVLFHDQTSMSTSVDTVKDSSFIIIIIIIIIMVTKNSS